MPTLFWCHVACFSLNLISLAFYLLTLPEEPPQAFEHQQMNLTSPRPLFIYPTLPPEVRWWDKTSEPRIEYNATTIYFWASSTYSFTHIMTSTSWTTSSTTTTTNWTTFPTSRINPTVSTASSTTSATVSGLSQPTTVDIFKPEIEVGTAFSWVIGGGMVKITYPGMSWKRRHQHPVKSKFRTSQKAIDPPQLAEYPDKFYFKEFIFMKHQRVATMCPLPNSNLTQPVLNPKGVLLNNAFWLCGGLVVTDTGENEPTSWCHTMGERFYIEQLNIKGWKPTLDLRVKMVGHSIVKTEDSFMIHNFEKLYHVKPNVREFDPDDRVAVDTIELPFSISHACLVNIGHSRVALIGGMNRTGPSHHMIIYDFKSKTFR